MFILIPGTNNLPSYNGLADSLRTEVNVGEFHQAFGIATACTTNTRNMHLIWRVISGTFKESRPVGVHKTAFIIIRHFDDIGVELHDHMESCNRQTWSCLDPNWDHKRSVNKHSAKLGPHRASHIEVKNSWHKVRERKRLVSHGGAAAIHMCLEKYFVVVVAN